jgi:hypothetical protein
MKTGYQNSRFAHQVKCDCFGSLGVDAPFPNQCTTGKCIYSYIFRIIIRAAARKNVLDI